MIKYFFLIMSLSWSADLDPRILPPFETKKVIPFMHEKLHEFKLLEEAIRREIKLVDTAQTSNKAELAYDNLEEYFMQLVTAREWGDKLFTGTIHSSAPKELLAACGYTQKDIDDQNSFKGVEFPGNLIRVLYKKEVYVITISSLVRDMNMCRVFVDHTFFLLYQRVVGACAVLKGELKCSDLISLIKMDRSTLIAYLAKTHFDGEVIAEIHRTNLARFMETNISYGIKPSRPESIEMVISPMSDHILELDRVYTEWSGLMRGHFHWTRMRAGKSVSRENEKRALISVISILEESLKIEISYKHLLYFIMIDEISKRYFEKYSERLKLFSSQMKKKSGRVIQLKPLDPTISDKIKGVKSELERLNREVSDWQKKVEDATANFSDQETVRDNLKHKIEHLQVRQLEVTAEIDDCKKHESKEADELRRLLDQFNKQRDRVNSLQKDISKLKQNIYQKSNERDSLNAKKIYSIDDIEQIVRESQGLKKHIDDLNAMLQDLMNPAPLKVLEEENRGLKKEKLEKQIRIEELKTRIAAKKGVS